MTTRIAAIVLALGALTLAGCHANVTQSRGADFRALGITAEDQVGMTDLAIRMRLARQPAATFPVTLATVRIQGGPSYSYASSKSSVAVESLRNVESTKALARLRELPQVDEVVPLSKLMIRSAENEQDFRNAAAQVHADMVLLYTFDTESQVRCAVPVVGVVTLGLAPNDAAEATSTASAVLIDTRTGYVYGVAEATGEASQLANAWTNDDARDDVTKRAERRALEKLLDEVETMWNGVVESQVAAAG